MTDHCPRRCAAIAGLLLLGLASPGVASTPTRPGRDKPLLQQIRSLFGYNPLLAPGGSRGDGPSLGVGPSEPLCLVSPKIQVGQTPPLAVVSLPRPTLLTQQPLAEWRLDDSSGTRLAGGLARSDRPITGAIPWPLPPLQPGEVVTLRMRSMQTSGSDFGTVLLQGADATSQALALQHLADPRDTVTVVRQLALEGDQGLALALLFDPSRRTTPGVMDLRQAIIRAGCAP